MTALQPQYLQQTPTLSCLTFSRMNLPSLYFWLSSYATSYFHPSTELQVMQSARKRGRATRSNKGQQALRLRRPNQHTRQNEARRSAGSASKG